MDAWARVLATEVVAAVDRVEEALQLCPPHLWDASMWEVRKDHPNVWPVAHVSSAGGTADAGEQERLLQWYSAFWNVAYHALFFVDADLSAASTSLSANGFAPPPPFREEDHAAHRVPDAVYSRRDLQRYVDHDRDKARTVLAGMPDGDLLSVVPDHRHGARTSAEILLGTVAHANEHAAQLHLFLGQQR